MSVSFRAMTLADVEAVFAIERLAYPFPWAKSIFEQAVASNKNAVVMEVDGLLAGYAIVSYVVGEAELLNICVSPNFQQRGLGQQLLAHLIKQATQSGNTDLYLEVRESNDQAIQLYQKAGFNEIGRRNRYYPTATGREDALLMALCL